VRTLFQGRSKSGKIPTPYQSIRLFSSQEVALRRSSAPSGDTDERELARRDGRCGFKPGGGR
jgi:hypothetical protein